MNPALPAFIDALREDIPADFLGIVDRVWASRNAYLRWPKTGLLFMPGTARTKYHKYSPEQLAMIKAAKLAADTRSNGPAIVVFLLAGGERPARANGREQWTIHHIYDGQYPAPGRSCSRAVIAGHLFTEAAGLVAAHPIADALADEFAYFAWLLRAEAYERFALDPDGVFSATVA